MADIVSVMKLPVYNLVVRVHQYNDDARGDAGDTRQHTNSDDEGAATIRHRHNDDDDGNFYDNDDDDDEEKDDDIDDNDVENDNNGHVIDDDANDEKTTIPLGILSFCCAQNHNNYYGFTYKSQKNINSR